MATTHVLALSTGEANASRLWKSGSNSAWVGIELLSYGCIPCNAIVHKSKWSVRNTKLRNTRILFIDLINRFLSTMPSRHTSNDLDLVKPTQYNVQLKRIAKTRLPKPWPLPDFCISEYGCFDRIDFIG